MTQPKVIDVNAPPPPPIRVAVCVPCMDEVKADFAYDLARMIGRFAAGPVADGQAELRIFFMKSSMLCSARMDLAVDATTAGCTHVLFIDSDMRFPGDTLERLLNHGKAIVGTNCVTRKFPVVPTSYLTIGAKDEDHVKLYTTEDSTGLQAVEATGTGVLLIDTEVFKRLPAPWFNSRWVGETGTFEGEDVYFCQLARKAGIQVWIDHDLSKQIGHVGTFEFKHQHANVIRADVEQAPHAQKIVTLDGTE